MYVRGWTTENRSALPSGVMVDRCKNPSVGSSAKSLFMFYSQANGPQYLHTLTNDVSFVFSIHRYYTALHLFFINNAVPYDHPIVVYWSSSYYILIVVILLNRIETLKSYVNCSHLSRTIISRLTTIVSVPMLM